MRALWRLTARPRLRRGVVNNWMVGVALGILAGCSSAPSTGGWAGGAPEAGGSTTASGSGQPDAATGSSSSGSPSPAGSASSSGGVSGSGSGSGSGSTPRPDGGPAAASSSGAGSSAGSGFGSGSSSGARPPPTSDGGVAANPFACKFAWGEPDPAGTLSSYSSYLQLASTWEGFEIQADGTMSGTTCSKCTWITQAAAANLVPTLYAYIIGYYGHANGLQDQNVNPNGPNLAKGMSALLLGAANASCPSGQFCAQNKVVQAYAWLAQQVQKATSKPVVWLLEGDYIQYTDSTQSQPLTFTQLGQLAGLITTAIKSNEPNAVVAIDYSTWNTDAATQSFWTAMNTYVPNYDLVWTSGVCSNGAFITTGTTASSYNGKTATWAYLRSYTGRKILTDSSDTCSTQSAATLNALIAAGLIGANMTPGAGYQGNVTAIEPQLNTTCP